MALTDQEQTTPVTPAQLAEMLATMNMSSLADPVAAQPALSRLHRRPFRRQSSGPLTPTSTTEESVLPRSGINDSPGSAANGLTPGQRAAALFGVGRATAEDVTGRDNHGPHIGAGSRGDHASCQLQRSHWNSRTTTSPTKPLARPRTFQRGSSTLVAPGTPDPRRRFVRHHTDPVGSPSSGSNSGSLPRPLAGCKRPCTTPPSLSPPRRRRELITSTKSLRSIPRAPEKRRSCATLFVDDRTAASYRFRLRRMQSAGEQDFGSCAGASEAEYSFKKPRRTQSDPIVETLQVASEGSIASTGLGYIPGIAPAAGQITPPLSTDTLRMGDPNWNAAAAVVQSPSSAIVSHHHATDPSSPCDKQAERLQAAKTIDMLVQSMELHMTL